MGSQTQEELESVKKELQNYKSLKLTLEQKDNLEKLVRAINFVYFKSINCEFKYIIQ